MDGIRLGPDGIEIRLPYNEKNLGIARALPDRDFKGEGDPHWFVPATPWHARQVVRGFKDLVGPDVVKLAGLDRIDLPEVSIEGLYPFQNTCVSFVERAGGRALIADDVGVGKTVEALGWVRQNGGIQDVVVVAPAIVTYKWAREVEKWVPGATAGVMDVSKNGVPDTDFIVCSYTMLRLNLEALTKRGRHLIILDEAHRLKEGKAQQTKATRKFVKGVPHILELTGRPFLNQPREMFYPLHILSPDEYPDWYRFCTRYTFGKEGHWTGLVNGEELRDRLAFRMIRRTKKEVLTDLPDLQRAILPFNLIKEDWEHYIGLEDEVFTDPNPAASIMKLWHETGKLKRKVAVDWATNFLSESDEKLIIFSHHEDVVDHLVGALQAFGSTCIKGTTAQKEREARAAKFQESRVPRVMVVSLAASEGIDLWRSSNILFVELPWVPAQMAQVEARAHRNGQKNAVTTWILMAHDTVDEHVWAVLKRKEELYEKLLKVDWTEETVKQEVISRMRERRKQREG